jgi:hypothetical protein
MIASPVMARAVNPGESLLMRCALGANQRRVIAPDTTSCFVMRNGNFLSSM